MEIVDVYVSNLWFHGLLYFSWMEPSARMIHALLSFISYLFSGNSQKRNRYTSLVKDKWYREVNLLFFVNIN